MIFRFTTLFVTFYTLQISFFIGLAGELKVNSKILLGGDTTVFSTSINAFAKPASNLPIAKLRDFTFGNKIFNTKWAIAPASVKSLDGLGPTFNRSSCSGCHLRDGRGRPPLSNKEDMDSMLIRISIPGTAEDGGPKPHSKYGGQINNQSIPGVPYEAKVKIVYQEIKGKFKDGEVFSLRKPKYIFEELQYGSLGKDILFSPRVAPAIHGLGLLEAISEKTILEFADPKDKNKDCISGRPNYTPDLKNKKKIGRFGWKANVVSLMQQDASAALGDIGITTSLNLEENCPDIQIKCREAIHGGSPEMTDEQLKKLVFYTQTLGVPARRDINNPTHQQGEKLFYQAKCDSCHRDQIKTSQHSIPQLSNQLIYPYTDLLLHDMGEALADDRPDYKATGKEWRTPPLWGIGLVKTVNKHTFFLHDGRARNLTEAILWHGGEAEQSKEYFRKMKKSDRDALIAFLNSL